MTALLKTKFAAFPDNIQVEAWDVKKWSALPVFFSQRNHKARMMMERHRSRFLQLKLPHLVVSAVCFPDGKVWKIDGHTRTEAWQTEGFPAPENVIVVIYHVQNSSEAREIYDMIDGRDSVKNGSDGIYSALREAKFSPISPLIASCEYNSPLNAVYGNAHKHFPKREQVKRAIPALRVFDSIFPEKDKFRMPCFTAVLMTIELDGVAALPFWVAYQKGRFDDGSKSNAPQIVARIVEVKPEAGAGGMQKMAGEILSVYFAWKQDANCVLDSSFVDNVLGNKVFSTARLLVKR